MLALSDSPDASVRAILAATLRNLSSFTEMHCLMIREDVQGLLLRLALSPSQVIGMLVCATIRNLQLSPVENVRSSFRNFTLTPTLRSRMNVFPQKYGYIQTPEPIQEQMEEVILAPGASMTVEVECSENDVILWYFYTEQMDIKLLLRFQHQDDYEATTIFSRRVENSSDVLTDIAHLVTVPGKYQLIFDNSYSWMNSKVLHYAVHAVVVKRSTVMSDEDVAVLSIRDRVVKEN